MPFMRDVHSKTKYNIPIAAGLIAVIKKLDPVMLNGWVSWWPG